MRYRLDRSFWNGRITAMILSAFVVGLFGQLAMAVQENSSAEPQFMSYAAFHNKWRSDQAAMKSILLNALDDEKAFDKFSFDWYPGFLQPRHFLRVGIGVTYNDRGYDGDLLTLNSDPDQATASSLGSAGRGSDDGIASAGTGSSRSGGDSTGGAGSDSSSKKPEAPAAGVDPIDFLRKYGGSLAEGLVSRLQERVSSSQLGSVLKHLDNLTELVPEPKKSAEEVASESGATARSSEGPGRGGGDAGPQKMASPQGSGSGGETTTGTAGGETSEATGSGGSAASTASTAIPASAKMLTATPENVKETYNSVIPGVVCLNEGKRDDLVAAAREKGLDLLFVLDIKVLDSRRVYYSVTNLRLFNLNDAAGADKTVVQTKAIRHDHDVKETGGKTSKELIDAELDKVFEEFDKQFSATALPGGLKPEHVENRINQVMASISNSTRLQAAVEVVAFFRKGLLDQAKASEYLDRIFNGGGQLLLTGTPEDRLAFLNKVLAESN